MVGASPKTVAKVNDQWRTNRAAPLARCQAALSDGECYHEKCPVQPGPFFTGWPCKLPWWVDEAAAVGDL